MAIKNIEKVGEVISSQEDQPGTSRSTRKIAAKLNIHRSSVQQIAKHYLRLTAFLPCPSTDHFGHSLERCRKLLRRLPKTATKKLFLLMRKTFISILNIPPVSNQNKCLSYREEVVQRASCVTHHRLASASVVGPYGLKDDCTIEKAKVNAKIYVDS